MGVRGGKPPLRFNLILIFRLHILGLDSKATTSNGCVCSLAFHDRWTPILEIISGNGFNITILLVAPGTEKAVKKKSTKHPIHLWEFLKQLLHDGKDCIRWIDQEKGKETEYLLVMYRLVLGN